MSEEIKQAALEYLRQGVSVIPVFNTKDGQKKPVTKWENFQRYAMSETEARRLFGRHNVTGIGLVCGAVSGDLYVRDYDEANAYSNLCSRFANRIGGFPIVRTYRG